MLANFIAMVGLVALFCFTMYQTVRQDERLDRARGSVRFLLVVLMFMELILLIQVADQAFFPTT